MPKDSHYNEIKVGDTVILTSYGDNVTGFVKKITDASIIIKGIWPIYNSHNNKNYMIHNYQPYRKDKGNRKTQEGVNMNITKIPFSMFAEHVHSLGIDVEKLVEKHGINNIKNVY